MKEKWIFEKPKEKNLSKKDELKKSIVKFLVSYHYLDHPMEEILRQVKTSYHPARKILRELVDEGIVIITRTIKRCNMYRINMNSEKLRDYIIKNF